MCSLRTELRIDEPARRRELEPALMGGHPVELPISISTLADVPQVREPLGLKDEALQHIDHPLE